MDTYINIYEMKKATSILLFIFFCNLSFGQGGQKIDVDSLLNELKKGKNDSARVDVLRELSEFYRFQNPDSSLLMIQQALDLAIKTRYQHGEIKSLFTKGKIFVSLGNYPMALDLYLQSLALSERIKSPVWIGINSNYIGELYTYENDYINALKYYNNAISIAKKNKFYSIEATAYYNITRIYENKNELDSAKAYGLKSMKTILLAKDVYMIARVYNTLGSISFKTAEINKAMEYYRNSLFYSKDVDDNFSYCVANLGIAKIFQSRGQIDSSLYYARQSLYISKKIGFMKQVIDASSFLSDHFKMRGMYDSALAIKEIYIEAKDSLISQDKIAGFQRVSFEDQLKRKEMEQDRIKYRNSIKTSILFIGLAGLLTLAFILWRNIRIKQKANMLLFAQKLEIDGQKAKVEESLKELTLTQAQLIQSEKMASLGELTAGIAHEIQNPLNFVNNFSEVSTELVDEMNDEIEKGNIEVAAQIGQDLKQNLVKINHHGKRAGDIVKGMLQHSRTSSGQKEPTDINALADEYLRLAYHGLRAKDKSFNATMKTDFDESIGIINVISQDLGRVILNLITNAFYVVNEKKNQNPEGYEPTVTVKTLKNPAMRDKGAKVLISVTDNGNGIPQKVLDKIFQPFFTTKPTGQGTGLGLSLSYDIVKAHGGELKVATKEGEGTEFTILLPITNS